MIKPKFLYHGSQNRNIKILEPRAESVRDENEGPVVFATPSKDLATVFLVPTNDSWTASGLFGDVPYFVCGDEERFRSVDKGGAVYKLPSDTFTNDLTRGLKSREWTSKEKVVPIGRREFESGLEAMIEAGIQVYFLTKEVFEKLKRSKDYGNKILRSSLSENIKLQKNVQQIPDIHKKS